jgi:hypothetical protein
MEASIVQKQFTSTSFGKVCYYSVGNKFNPLFLIVHGSGVNNSGKVYENFLYEYHARFRDSWELYMVAFDCPGYGESTGLRSTIRGFPEKFIREFIGKLGNEKCFILMGHSQGGYSVFNAILQNPNLSTFVVQDRPVCGNIWKLKDWKTPILLSYDEEDDGHPIKQGREIIKVVKNFRFFSYKSSETPYWFSDRLLEEILKFIYSFQQCIPNKYMPDFSLITQANGINFDQEISTNVNIGRPETRSRSVNPKEEVKINTLDVMKEITKRSCSVIKEVKVEEDNIDNIDNMDNIEKIDMKKLETVDVETDFKCPLCLDFLIKPIQLPCGHIFCYYCLDMSITYNPSCPLCRKDVDNPVQALQNLAKDVQERLIKHVDIDLLKKREDDIIKERNKAKLNSIKIEYGNTSTPITSSKHSKPKYRWALFVKVVSSPKQNPIKTVEFDINPHLQDSVPIKVQQEPFEFDRNGSYEFGLNIKVIFMDRLKLQPYTINHRLRLGPPKTSRQFVVQLK